VDLCLLRPPAGDAGSSGSWAARAGRALHPARLAADGDWLWAVASGLASVAVPWELRDTTVTGHDGERVLATDRYEAWVLSWAPGTHGEWHVHEGPGAFCVVSGALVETSTSTAPARSTGAERATRRFGPGAGTVFGPGDRHRIATLGATTATSLHVYTLPAASGDATLGSGPSPADDVSRPGRPGGAA
jgi:mannose-6-phosphate isomerase-like protein (cupin superfamily)